MDGMFYHDQKQKEQAQLKLQIDSEQYFQKVEGQDLLSEQYSYFEKPESELTGSIPKDAEIKQAAVMSFQEKSKKSKDEKDLEKKALEVSDKESLFKGKLNKRQAPVAAESKELMESKIDAIKLGLVVSKKKIKEYYEPLISKGKDKEKLEREYDLALKKARYESARDIGKAASYYVETLKAADASEETLIDACAQKEELLVKADAYERAYRASSISNQQEREREEHTVKKHYWYDSLKAIFRKSNPYSHEGAVIERDGHRYVNVGRAFFGGTKPMYIFEDRSEGAGVEGEDHIIRYPQFLYKEAINCIGMEKPEGGLATEAAAKIQKLISGEYAIDAFAVRDKDGKVCGSLQRKLDKYDPKTGGAPEVNLYSWQEEPKNSISGQGDAMDKRIKNEVLREHTLDWLLCNFDTKGENFIYRTDRHLSSFDKEASFSFLKDPRSKTMSLDYMPHSHNTIYNVLFTSFIECQQDLDFKVIEDNIRKVEDMVKENDGADYMANFKDMLDQKYGPESPKNTKRKEAYDLILKRATDIRETYSVFLGQLIVKRDEFIKKNNSTKENPLMQSIEYVTVEGSGDQIPRLIFSDEREARAQFDDLKKDHSAEIHLEKLGYAPENLAELKRATDAFLVKCEAIKGLRGQQKLQFDDIFAKMKEQKKRLDGYTPEDINSGAWLDKEKGLYFSLPKEIEKISLEVTELPDVEMKSIDFEKFYKVAREKNGKDYTREKHYVNACWHHLHQFSKKTQAICEFPVGGGLEFSSEYSQLLNRVRSGKAVRSDITHLEKLKGAFVFLEKMMNDVKAFDDSHPAVTTDGASVKLKEDINALCTGIKTTVGHFWNLLAKELKNSELKHIEMIQNTDNTLDWPAMIRSGVMSKSIDQYIFMAQNTELAKSPEMQKIAYSSKRLEADELSKTREGAELHISVQEAELRLDDMDVKESVSQAVLIAHDTEMETKRLLDELKQNGDDLIEIDAVTKVPVKKVLDDYVMTSRFFREHLLLKQKINEGKQQIPRDSEDLMQYNTREFNVQSLDTALKRLALLRSGSYSQPMTSYRYACYKDTEKEGPFTINPFGHKIFEGDIVMDVGFCSTSAAKQFIGLEETSSTTVTSYVKMSITGTSGVPIADPDGAYSNQTKAQEGQAGQAEILYPRNTCFRVVKIRNKGDGDDKVSGVVLEEVKKDDLPKEQVIKDIYTGETIMPQQ